MICDRELYNMCSTIVVSMIAPYSCTALITYDDIPFQSSIHGSKNKNQKDLAVTY